MRLRFFALAVMFALGTVARAEAATITVATFEDPSKIATNPLFVFTKGTGTSADPTGSILRGGTAAGWVSDNIVLKFSPTSTDYAGVTFTLGPLTATGSSFLCGIEFGGGAFTFFQGAQGLLTYSFTSACLTSLVFGGSTLDTNGVSITVPGGSPFAGWSFFDPQAFAFSFANPTNTIGMVLSGSATTASWTAAFTSSATTRSPIPEPGSMILLGTGLLGLGHAIRRRTQRRKLD